MWSEFFHWVCSTSWQRAQDCEPYDLAGRDLGLRAWGLGKNRLLGAQGDREREQREGCGHESRPGGHQRILARADLRPPRREPRPRGREAA